MAWVTALALPSALSRTAGLPDKALGRLVCVHGEAQQHIAPHVATEGTAMAALVRATRDLRTFGPAIRRVGRGGVEGRRSNTAREVVNLRAPARLRDLVGAEVEGLHDAVASREDARRRAEVFAESAGQKLGGDNARVEEGAHRTGDFRAYQTSPFDLNPAGVVTRKADVYVSFDQAPR